MKGKSQKRRGQADADRKLNEWWRKHKAWTKMVHERHISRGPATVPAGRLIIHNHVLPAHSLGWRGFRAWSCDDCEGAHKKYVRCRCGWWPHLPEHYRVRGVNGRGWTPEKIAAAHKKLGESEPVKMRNGGRIVEAVWDRKLGAYVEL